MTPIKAYHRPTSIASALTLLNRPGIASAILAGGAHLNARSEGIDEVIDLQAAGLEGITREPLESGDRLRVGAMTRLQTLVDCADAPSLIRQAAHAEGPNTFRNQATLGGVVAGADAESELLAALLVYEAEVTMQTLAGNRTLALSSFLADAATALAGGIITEVSLATQGAAASDRVARTPADKPIVAVTGRKRADGQTFLAACGVAPTPILINSDHLGSLNPPADFRGSSAYRSKMAALLVARVMSRLGAA